MYFREIKKGGDSMARPREPIDLIKAKGKKHLTKSEYEERKSQEVDVPFVNVTPPSYLTAKQKKVFKEYAKKLTLIGIMTELDVDCLARYVLSQDLYLAYTEQITQAMQSGDIALLKEMQNLQDKAFKQAQSSARDLGLTITSRCKIVMPAPPEDDDDEL